MSVTGDPGDSGGDLGVGERLATWLEGLGLADVLADAGLPTYQRDLGGVVRWTDTATGKPLTGDQLRQLDRVLHQEGDDPDHAVPVALVQLRRLVRVRAGLLASPVLGYAGLAELRGVSENAARFAAHKESDRHRLLLVPHEGEVLVPGFQLTAEGELREELAPVLAPLLAGGLDPWQVWAWLTQPAGLLGGMVPERAATDPEEAAIVQHAAVRLAERAIASANE
ncbi:hypothetical protein [Nocardioides sambongensis]|uniref:hypothetical protein n=1 Tax=Nocardioides sambongensis TaxID=2589074 RepID=UPI00112DCEED|nr:hypothetical protein [Nocardioides sambongensis]